tara:strand:+ start:7137 stop:7733 length:597 start_codon:yes stop_codon:yes gene_type:complete
MTHPEIRTLLDLLDLPSSDWSGVNQLLDALVLIFVFRVVICVANITQRGYPSDMTDKHPPSLRALLFLLLFVVGPLQAQSVFACPMMDKVVHGECCCVGQSEDKDCVDATCEAALQADFAPCCDRSVELSLDTDARLDTPIQKPVELSSAVDPPPAILAIYFDFLPPQSEALIPLFSTFPEVSHSVTDTYLITQRLRI